MSFSESELLRKRIRLGPPSPREEQRSMDKLYPSTRTRLLGAYSRTTAVLDAFSIMRVVEQNTGVNPSKPRLCADILLTAPFASDVERALRRKDNAGSRFYYDMWCGLSNTADLILLAEDHLSGNNESIANHMLQAQTYDPRGQVSSSADTYAATTKTAQEVAAILKKYRTGVEVLEYGVEQIKTEEPWEHTWQSRAYTLAGARLAVEAYQILYQTLG